MTKNSIKIDLTNKTLTQFLKLYGFGWDILEKNKVISNKTYYRWLNGKTKPQEKKIKIVCKFLKIDKETFLKLLENDIKKRQ